MLFRFLSFPLRGLAVLLASLCFLGQSIAALNGTATVSWVQSGDHYDYNIKLTNTGTTNIGTLWYAWVPGADYLPTRPSAVGSPTGWPTPFIVQGTPGFSIEWIATTPLAPGQSQNGFTFSSTDAPSVIFGNSTAPGNPKVGTTFLYSGGPFSDVGLKIVATELQQPSNAFKLNALSVIGGGAVSGSVTLDHVAAANTVIPITSNNVAASVSGGGVTVLAGHSSANFLVPTKGVAASTAVKLTANFGSSTLDASLTVKPAALSSFVLSTSVVGGNPPTATAVFDGFTGSVRPVGIGSNAPAVVTAVTPQNVPAQVKAKALVVQTHGVDATASVTVTLSEGAISLPKLLKVLPATVKSIIGPETMVGGTTPGFTARLSGFAGPSGKLIHATTDNASILSFPNGTVLFDTSSVVLRPTSAGVAVPTDVVVSVGTAIHFTTRLLPASLKSVTSSVPTIVGGNSLVIAANLDGRWSNLAGALAATTSDTALATVPASTPIAPQSVVTKFVCKTKPVIKDSLVTIFVTVKGVTKSVQVLIKAPTPVRP